MEINQIVKYVSSNKIYNLPLFETYMLIDCRENQLYQQNHIASALNYPPSSLTSNIHDDNDNNNDNNNDNDNREEGQLNNLEKFVNYASLSYINEIWDPIILYSDNTNKFDINNHVIDFCNLLVEYISKKSLTKTSNDQKRQRTNHLFSHISEKTKNIWILENGFQDFQNIYPFLCVPTTIDDPIGGMNMIPLPYHLPIGNGIFIGSRAIRWNLELLNQFQIQSVLLDIQSFHTYSQPLTELSLETMISSIPDHISNQTHLHKWPISQLHQFLDSSTQFIQDCIQQSKKLLVQLHGRSHSCMIIIAWMMRYQSLSFDDSYNQLMGYISPTNSLRHLNESFLLKKELQQWQPGGQYLIENENNSNHHENNSNSQIDG